MATLIVIAGRLMALVIGLPIIALLVLKDLSLGLITLFGVVVMGTSDEDFLTVLEDE